MGNGPGWGPLRQAQCKRFDKFSREFDEVEIIEMIPDIPAWARQRVSPDVHDFFDVRQMHGDGRTQIQLPDLKELKGWAKSHGWPTPWFGTETILTTWQSFYDWAHGRYHMLEDGYDSWIGDG